MRDLGKESILAAFALDVSHQEVARIIDELEQTAQDVFNAAGREAWVPILAATNIVCHDLGYEDQDALEDAVKGSFEEFIQKIPLFETRISDGQFQFRLLPEATPDEWRPMKKILKVKSSEDTLGRVCMKAKNAVIEIPELEFEIAASGKRVIDTVYNHISGAIFELTRHAAHMSDEQPEKVKILEAVSQLESLLDMDVEWTLILHDPTGESEFNPGTGVETVYLDVDTVR